MMAGSIEKPEDVFNFGLAHEEQSFMPRRAAQITNYTDRFRG